jgi:hypothetical protein
MSPDRHTLFVLLQSALIQDLDATSSATIRHTRKNTRLLAYDLRGKESTLVGEYAVQLPQFPDPASTTGQTLTAAQSELHALNDRQFLVLARDSGNGFSDPTSTSAYRSVDLIDISHATNLAGTKFDSPANPIAPKGVLDPSITPALYEKFDQPCRRSGRGEVPTRNSPMMLSASARGAPPSVPLKERADLQPG